MTEFEPIRAAHARLAELERKAARVDALAILSGALAIAAATLTSDSLQSVLACVIAAAGGALLALSLTHRRARKRVWGRLVALYEHHERQHQHREKGE